LDILIDQNGWLGPILSRGNPPQSAG